MGNNKVLGLRLPEELLTKLDKKEPNVAKRNYIIRALIQKWLSGEIKVLSYDMKLTEEL